MILLFYSIIVLVRFAFMGHPISRKLVISFFLQHLTYNHFLLADVTSGQSYRYSLERKATLKNNGEQE